jgi:hypothetical protein
MSRICVKSIVAAGAATGLALSTVGVALPAGKPQPQDPRRPVKMIALYNQSRLIAEGLSPKAALKKVQQFERAHVVTTAHYMPKGFRLAVIRVYPYIPYNMELGDTQQFLNLSKSARPSSKLAQATQWPSFEIDHQFGGPYSYDSNFVLKRVTLGKVKATVVEEKGRDMRTHKTIDLYFVNWYDSKTKLATQVTADLVSSHLNAKEMIKIAASIH